MIWCITIIVMHHVHSSFHNESTYCLSKVCLSYLRVIFYIRSWLLSFLMTPYALMSTYLKFHTYTQGSCTLRVITTSLVWDVTDILPPHSGVRALHNSVRGCRSQHTMVSVYVTSLVIESCLPLPTTIYHQTDQPQDTFIIHHVGVVWNKGHL